MSSESPTISIADFLEYVKEMPLANEIFSKDVADKLGIARTKGTLSADTRFAETLQGRGVLEALMAEEPTLGQKIVSFFTRASKDYAGVPKLSRAARKYLRVYKKLFAEFSARNYQRNASESVGARGGERHSFSSIANAFYGDGEMSAEEFERGDYDFGAAERFFADREQIRRNEILQQIENGEHRETLRASNLDAEGVEQYVAGKRREVAREVVDRGDTRFALPDIDDVTFSEYNEEKVIRADIARLQSEALTWDAKYRNTLRIRTLSNGFTYRYTIDDDGIVHVYDKEKAINMHEWREDYGNTDSTQFNSLAEEFGIGRRDNGVDSRFGKNGREQAEDDRRYNRSLRSEGRSDRAGYTEDRSYADGAQEVRERNTRNAPRKGERKRAIRYHFDEDGSGHGTVTYADGTSARFALPETDSEGMHLTKTQQEFFKDSKVRDSNGRLLVVYHGTPDGKFYEFSYGKAGKVGGSQHGYGFYFSDSERDAKLYTQGTGTIIKAHLNITNPIDAMGKDLSSGVGAILDRLPMYAKGNLREQYGDLETARRRFSKLDNGTMLSVLCSNTEMHPEVFNTILLNLGYDGIVYSEDGYATEYVAFKSSQAKETNNKKPTQHPDMRYALPFDDPFLDALYESDDTDVRSEVFDAAGIIAKGLPYDTGKVASVGEMRKLQANYTKDRVYSKKDALGVVSRFEDADVLKPKSRAERVGKDAIFKVRGFPRYNSKVIKIEPTGGQFRISSSSSRPGVGSINSISDLYELVKAFGKDFSVEKEQGLTNQARRGILLLSRRQFGSKPQLKWRWKLIRRDYMKSGRGRILIVRSFLKRDLQVNTVERILDHLRNISKAFGGEAADKRAEQLMPIIEDERNTETDILAILEEMEKQPDLGM